MLLNQDEPESSEPFLPPFAWRGHLLCWRRWPLPVQEPQAGQPSTACTATIAWNSARTWACQPHRSRHVGPGRHAGPRATPLPAAILVLVPAGPAHLRPRGPRSRRGSGRAIRPAPTAPAGRAPRQAPNQRAKLRPAVAGRPVVPGGGAGGNGGPAEPDSEMRRRWRPGDIER